MAPRANGGLAISIGLYMPSLDAIEANEPCPLKRRFTPVKVQDAFIIIIFSADALSGYLY